MKAKNGGIGMTDDEVKAFIGRYMPGYELWLEGVQSAHAPWKGRGLQLVVGEEREILGTRDF
jgi:D-glycerate 3-kinase